METEYFNPDFKRVDFDLKKAIEQDPTAQMISAETLKLFKNYKSPEYSNMVKFIKWLRANQKEAVNTLYFHILIGSTPENPPTAPDLQGEYSIEKFVRDGFPDKHLN